MSGASKGSRIVNAVYIFFAAVCFIIGIASMILGMRLDSDSAELIGMYDFKAVSSDHTRDSHIKKEHTGGTKKVVRKQVYTDNYFIVYAAEGTEYTFKDKVSKEKYNAYNQNPDDEQFKKPVRRNVWKVGDKFRYELESVTESDVKEKESRRKTTLYSIGGIFIMVGAMLAVTCVMKAARRKARQ